MAAVGFLFSSKTTTLPFGTSYAYVSIPRAFASKGHGVIATDLLSYGGTDKPDTLEPCIFKTITADIAQLLNHKNIEKVDAVGHDFGSLSYRK
ncbi:hypothetical protein BELL_0509g00010 [Botrytis elliptica]|uniref:AB hydrolase-1 domain-containing protein n=1 Tax=Botrytis elliptica TaxID=278938 RepID=A0A4Z1JL30_9HELO|nr:hypothetical protein BELL_0509g00010 [Botrytis elliptica]